MSSSYFDTCLYRVNPIKSYIEKAVKTESDNVQPQKIKAQANHTEIREKTNILDIIEWKQGIKSSNSPDYATYLTTA